MRNADKLPYMYYRPIYIVQSKGLPTYTIIQKLLAKKEFWVVVPIPDSGTQVLMIPNIKHYPCATRH